MASCTPMPVTGPSPRIQGAGRREGRAERVLGANPAGAGSRRSDARGRPGTGDHPRWCGKQRPDLVGHPLGVGRVIDPPDLAACPQPEDPLGLDDPRIPYHATMHIVQTPALKKAVAVARRLWLVGGPRSEGPLHLAVDGPGETGMTTVLRQIGRA